MPTPRELCCPLLPARVSEGPSAEAGSGEPGGG